MASKVELKMLKDFNMPYYLTFKKVKLDQFFIGLFGALAIFGVLMKIWKEPFWGLVSPETAKLLFEIFMPIGFIGESIVFIVMGFLKGEANEKLDVVDYEKYIEDDADEANSQQVVVNLQMPEELTAIIKEKASNQLDEKIEEISQLLVHDLEKTRGHLLAVNELNEGIHTFSKSLVNLSEDIKQVSIKLEELQHLEVDLFKNNTKSFINNLEATDKEITQLENQMKILSGRFKNFNSNNHHNSK